MNQKPVGTWSGITAPVGSALRRSQLIVDHHVGAGSKLIYGPDALARAIAYVIDITSEKEKQIADELLANATREVHMG